VFKLDSLLLEVCTWCVLHPTFSFYVRLKIACSGWLPFSPPDGGQSGSSNVGVVRCQLPSARNASPFVTWCIPLGKAAHPSSTFPVRVNDAKADSNFLNIGQNVWACQASQGLPAERINLSPFTKDFRAGCHTLNCWSYFSAARRSPDGWLVEYGTVRWRARTASQSWKYRGG